MTRILFLRKVRQNLLLLLTVFLCCCHHVQAQELATEEDFPEVDVSTSADGRYSIYSERVFERVNDRDIRTETSFYWHDSGTDTTLLVYKGFDALVNTIISANGNFVAFSLSEMSGPETYRLNLYVHDIDTRETILVSADGTEASYPTSAVFGVDIGPDGRYITYSRGLGSRSILYLYDSLDGSLNSIVNDESCAPFGSVSQSDLSADEQYIAYVYTCEEPGLFLYHIDSKTHTQLDTNGVDVRNVRPAISENNQYVRFNAPGEVAGSIYDRTLGEVYPFGLSAECIDSDGDGWGFNEYLEESCRVEQLTQSACDYSSAEIHVGWGWDPDLRQSCPPLTSTDTGIDTITSAENMECDYTNASLFNGWGWNPETQESCAPVTDPGPGITAENGSTDCDYTNADAFNGWGWNNRTRESCAPLTQEQSFEINNCDYSDADLNSGWGWNPVTGQSCEPR